MSLQQQEHLVELVPQHIVPLTEKQHEQQQSEQPQHQFTIHKDSLNNVNLTIVCDNLSIIEPIFAAPTSGDGTDGDGGEGASQEPKVFTNPILAPLCDVYHRFRYYVMGNEEYKCDFYRIKDFSGVVQPGTTTLILGAPGCGRGTLLRTLSGQMKDISRGAVYYNGLTIAEAKNAQHNCDVKQKMLKFIDQTDAHFEMLTVRELLDFQYKLVIDVDVEYKEDYVDNIIAAFDMKECSNTPFAKLSGGQKKRVSVMSGLTNPHSKLLCFKNPTDGLDSAVSERVVFYLKEWAAVNNAAVVIAMQQPSPNIFLSFDQLIVLKEGETVYYGPTVEVEAFFAAMGYPAPDDLELSQHLLSVLTFPKLVLQEYQIKQRVAQKQKQKQRQNQSNNNASASLNAIAQTEDGPGGEEDDALDDGNLLQLTIALPNSATSRGDRSPHNDSTAFTTNIHTTPVETSHGLLYPSLCPCITKEEMVKFYKTSPMYRFARDLIAHTRALRKTQKLKDYSQPLGVIGVVAEGQSPVEQYELKDHDFIVLQHQQQLDLLQYDNAQNPALASPTSPALAEYFPTSSQATTPTSQSAAPGVQQNQPLEPTISFGPLVTPETRTFYSYGYTLGLLSLLLLVLSRQASMAIRDRALMVTKLIPVMLQSVLFGGIYFQLDLSNYSSRLGCIGDVLTELTFNGLSISGIVLRNKQILQSQLSLYPMWMYTLSFQLCSLPMAFVESAVLTAISYFMIGHTPEAGNFFLFWVMLTMHAIAISAMFCLVGTMSKNASYAYAFLGVVMVILYVSNGFYLRTTTVPTGLVWLVYASPYSWGLRSMAIIEFSASRYDYLVSDPSGVFHRAGDYYLQLSGVLQGWEWLGYSVIYCLGLIITFVALQAYFLNDPYKEYTIGTQRLKVHDGSDGVNVEYCLDEKEHFLEQLQDDQEVYDHHAACAAEPSVSRYNANNSANQPPQSKFAAGNQKLNALTNKLTFTPSTLSWKNLTLTVNAVDEKTGLPYKRKLLQNITGFAQMGTSTALMGSSGAGKTTLLNTLYGLNTTTNTMQVEGTFYVNGKPLAPKEYSAFTGYVEQFSDLAANETVYETLYFAAKMKLVGVEEEVLREVVEETLDVLELTPVKHTLCGSPLSPSLSPSQMKRVSIGVVLVSNPTILFLDEPTTGLDSAAASTVVRAISRIARSGRACITTIHQPDASLFYNFDNLLLLGQGGFTLYFGRMGYHAKNIVTYFEGFDESIVQPWKKGTNVAEWMIDQTSTVPDAGQNVLIQNFAPTYQSFYENNPDYSPPVVISSGDDGKSLGNNNNNTKFTPFAALSPKQQFIQYLSISFLQSPLWDKAKQFLTQLNSGTATASTDVVVDDDDGAAVGVGTTHVQQQTTQDQSAIHQHQYIGLPQQIYYVTKRTWHIYSRDAGLFYPRMVIFVFLSFFVSLIYMNIQINSLNTLITFLSSTTISSANILYGLSLTIIPIFNENRSIFYKEQQKKLYHSFVLPLAYVLCESLVILPLSLVGFVIYYFSVNGIAAAKAFFAYWLGNYLLGFCFVSWTLFLSFTFPRYAMSELINNVSAAVFFAFAGIGMTMPKMNVVFRGIARLMPVYYVTRMIAIMQFEHADEIIDVVLNDQSQKMTVRDLAETYLGYQSDQYGWSVLWLCTFIGAVFCGAIFSSTFFRWKNPR